MNIPLVLGGAALLCAIIPIILWWLFPDFLKFLRYYLKTTFSSLKCSFYDYGEPVVTAFAAVAIAASAWLFYKSLTCLSAFVLTHDLIGYYTLLRNVFTIAYPDELGYSLTITNIVAGGFLSPAAEFLSVGYIVWAIGCFTDTINAKYRQAVYSEKDNFFLGFCCTILFILIQAVTLLQFVDHPWSTLANIVYVYFSKLALIPFFLTVYHVRLLISEEDYKSELTGYFSMSTPVQQILFNPYLCMALVYVNAVLINLPLFLGQQFLLSVPKFVLALVFNLVLFWAITDVVIKKALSYLAVVVMAESDKLEPISVRFPISGRLKRTGLLVLGLSSALLLIAEPRLFLFGLSLLFIVGLFGLFVHIVLYSGSLAGSFAAFRFIPETSKLKRFVDYWATTALGLTKALVPAASLGIVVLTLLSLKPKELCYENPNIVNAILDPEGNLLFAENYDGNRCIAVSKEDVDSTFYNQLYRQEDQSFTRQRSFFPHVSNWNGLSFGGLRILFGGTGSSNINNQLIKNLAHTNLSRTPRDLSRKFSEASCSYQLSIQLSPEDIVNYYINTAYFCGGQTRGLYAASYQVFQKPPCQLNPLQSFFLVRTLTMGPKYWCSSTGEGISYKDLVQREAQVKSDLLNRAGKQLRQGLITPEDYLYLSVSDLNFTKPDRTEAVSTTTREFLKKEIPRDAEKMTYRSSISMANQTATRAGARQFENRFSPYLKKGKFNLYYAAVVVDVETGEIIGHYGGNGNTDLTTFGNGQPMASLIKPPVLQELTLELGEEVQLYDGPVPHKYTPKNFDHLWTYRFVGVGEIIKYSKNAPVVNIREQTDAVELYRKVEDRFAMMGIMPDPDLNFSDTKWCEINYPLGSRKMQLRDIAQVYQTLLNDGRAKGITALQSSFNPKTHEVMEISPKVDKQIYEPGSTDVITNAMEETIYGGTASSIRDMLPPGNVYYVKTGTTENATKCYCALSDGKILILCYVNYGTIVNSRLELNNVPSVPFHNNSTATSLAAMLYKKIISKN